MSVKQTKDQTKTHAHHMFRPTYDIEFRKPFGVPNPVHAHV